MTKSHRATLPENPEFTGQGRFVSYISLFPKCERSLPSNVVVLPLRIVKVDIPPLPVDLPPNQTDDLRRSVETIAHDFNNALVVLNCALGVMEECSQIDDPASFGMVKTSALRMKELAASLTALSHDESPPAVDWTDASETLHMTAKSCIAGSDVDLHVSIDGPLTVRADMGQFARIVQNLVINAVQAMERKGRLMVSGRTVTVNDLHLVEIAVSDTGCGIAPDVLPRIFDAHFSTKDDGMGIGLSIVETFVEAQKGTISVTSVPGQGSTFTLRFPSRPKHDGGS